MLHVVDGAAPEAWQRLWWSGPPFSCAFALSHIHPKPQTYAVTSSVDPTTPFCKLPLPLRCSLPAISEAQIYLFLSPFFFHDDESEALAFLPCTPPSSEASPFWGYDRHARPVASYLRSQCSHFVVCNSYLDLYWASLQTAGRSMGPGRAATLIPRPKIVPTGRSASLSCSVSCLCLFGAPRRPTHGPIPHHSEAKALQPRHIVAGGQRSLLSWNPGSGTPYTMHNSHFPFCFHAAIDVVSHTVQSPVNLPGPLRRRLPPCILLSLSVSHKPLCLSTFSSRAGVDFFVRRTSFPFS
jgi:hypothetical protein